MAGTLYPIGQPAITAPLAPVAGLQLAALPPPGLGNVPTGPPPSPQLGAVDAGPRLPPLGPPLPTGNPELQGLPGAAAPGMLRSAGGATTVGSAPSPRTFQEFYADAARDPLRGVYERIMSRFDPEQVVAVEAATLFEQAVTSNSGVPQAYLCCASTRRGPRIYCVHLPSRFPSALDGRITPWDNQVYAFLGETTNGTATTVVFPNN